MTLIIFITFSLMTAGIAVGYFLTNVVAVFIISVIGTIVFASFWIPATMFPRGEESDRILALAVLCFLIPMWATIFVVHGSAFLLSVDWEKWFRDSFQRR